MKQKIIIIVTEKNGLQNFTVYQKGKYQFDENQLIKIFKALIDITNNQKEINKIKKEIKEDKRKHPDDYVDLA